MKILDQLLIDHVFALVHVQQLHACRRLEKLIQPTAAPVNDGVVLFGIAQAAVQVVLGFLQQLDTQVEHFMKATAVDFSQALLKQPGNNQ